MASVSVPSPYAPSASSFSRNRNIRRPLSDHGMPKSPQTAKPPRLNPFSGLGFSPMAPLRSPRSPGALSPPISARSFGTFIDSEPSTPAYSPGMDSDWDGSTLVLLRPVSTWSEPSSPTEPMWDMKASPNFHPPRIQNQPRQSPKMTKEVPVTSTISPRSIKQSASPKSPPVLREIKVVDLPKNYVVATREDAQNEEQNELQEEQSAAVPLGKFTAKVKLMLRRSNSNEKKKAKKDKYYHEVIHLDNKHWTEM